MPIRTRKRPRKIIRRRASIKSNAGSVMAPLDVRSQDDLSGFLKRITKGPITIVMVYADWCGHCQTMKPIFDSASASPQRSCQVVKVKDDMFEKVNASIKRLNANAQPMEVEGYPTIMAIDHQGNKVTEINAVKDKNVMIKVMNESGTLAMKSTAANGATTMTTGTESAVPAIEEISEESMGREPLPLSSSQLPLASSQLPLVSPPRSNKKMTFMLDTAASRPNPMENTMDSVPRYTIGGGHRRQGGSLYSSMAQTAYTLAPAALLLATASAVMKRSHTQRKRSAHTRRSAHKKSKKRHH